MNYKQIQQNISDRDGKIEYFVIHDTANYSRDADAESHFKYFNKVDRQSSADIFVDSTQILKINDYKKKKSWAVGDGNGKYGITNNNSISMEICVNVGSDWSKTYQNAINATIECMKDLNLGLDKVVRHYDASRKNCPAFLSYNNWEGWEIFYTDLTKQYNESIKPVILSWNEIIEKITDYPKAWEDAIEYASELAKASNSDLGDLEVFEWLPLLIVSVYQKRSDKLTTFEDIIRNSSTEPDRWIKAFNTAVNTANADGNMGKLETFKYLPLLISKINKGAK